MNLIERAKNMLVSPKTEWEKIANENEPHAKVMTGYLLWLALIPAIAALIGYGLIGYKVLGVRFASMEYGVKIAVQMFVSIVAGAYVAAYAISSLAEKYGCEKNFNKAFSLVAFGYTATCVGGFFYLIPGLRILASLASLYTLYILYVGFQPMTKVADDKKSSYIILSIVLTAVVWFVFSLVLGALLGIKTGSVL